MPPVDPLELLLKACGNVDVFSLFVKVYALILSVVAVVLNTGKLRHLWRTRHLRKVWGIKNRDSVVLVCSELDDPEEKQNLEPREFIYSLKYGDVDAYFEAVTTLLRLYPDLRLRVVSAGEAQGARMDLTKHLVLIGGPDYNAVTEHVLGRNVTRFDYRSPDSAARSEDHPEEIALYDRIRKKEFSHETDMRDFGYFERIVNPNNPDARIILIGGCHTIGVAGAVKSFSMADSEDGAIPPNVLRNASLVAKRVGKRKEFSVLVEVERVGQTISVPVVKNENIMVLPA